MKLLTKVESAAEFIITYFFRKSVNTIQPVEVAKELLKAMLRKKQVSISHVYVPNIYKVYLNKADYDVLESFGKTFRVELAKHLYEEGSRQGYTFLTLPVVEILVGSNIAPGNIDIKTEFNDSVVVLWQTSEEKEIFEPEDLENTTVLPRPVRYSSVPENGFSRKRACYLEIIKGKDQGKKYRLEREEIIIGRNKECDIEIDDPEISRRHLRLFTENGRWFVEDLQSTNGTYVNKLRVDRYRVNPGDKIKAGQTYFRFKVEK